VSCVYTPPLNHGCLSQSPVFLPLGRITRVDLWYIYELYRKLKLTAVNRSAGWPIYADVSFHHSFPLALTLLFISRNMDGVKQRCGIAKAVSKKERPNYIYYIMRKGSPPLGPVCEICALYGRVGVVQPPEKTTASGLQYQLVRGHHISLLFSVLLKGVLTLPR
jgi:hypothetical protein